jgi:protein-tyrosine phosphatase
MPMPVAVSGVTLNGNGEAVSAEQVCRIMGEELALVVDDGPSRYALPPTLVEVNGNSWTVLREGVVPMAELERQTTCLIVFVCTGNTCRSPLAEALCKKRLAEQLQCPVEELPQRGFLVLSAGMAASMGDSATPEAAEAGRRLGADLSSHVSRPLTPDLAAQADHVLAMTRGHLALLAARYPDTGCRPQLLSPRGEDVPDPIGGEQPVYEECAQQISHHVEALVAEISAS